MASIPLVLTQEHPCCYLEGEMAQSLFVHPAFPLTPQSYERLLSRGFRRSGDEVYAPHCLHCSECIPVRIPVLRFKPDRSQKRCLQKNLNTRAVLKPAVFEQKHYDLYLRYQNFKHQNGIMALAEPDEYLGFLGSTWCDTHFVEFNIDEKLSAVAVIDSFEQAWSAVYTFYDPEFSDYSPGVYAVLWQIDQIRKSHGEYLYLGYWIKNCRKMNYKSQYRPLQYFLDEKWVEFASDTVKTSTCFK